MRRGMIEPVQRLMQPADQLAERPERRPALGPHGGEGHAIDPAEDPNQVIVAVDRQPLDRLPAPRGHHPGHDHVGRTLGHPAKAEVLKLDHLGPLVAVGHLHHVATPVRQVEPKIPVPLPGKCREFAHQAESLGHELGQGRRVHRRHPVAQRQSFTHDFWPTVTATRALRQ